MKIINTVFQRYCQSEDLPRGLIPDLLSQFSSSRGYRLYPDVLPFFHSAREARRSLKPQSPLRSTLIGVLTNSDDRVPSILSDLGLKIGALRHGTVEDTPQVSFRSHHENDIDFVALSYDIGHEKPHAKIFEAAKELGEQIEGGFENLVHVGDDLEKDVKAAKAADWRGIMLARDQLLNSSNDSIRDLSELEKALGPNRS